MLIGSTSIHSSIVATPAGPAPAVHPGLAAVPIARSDTGSASQGHDRPPVAQAADEALQARYFEDMINTAADLLLRSQIPGAASRFDF